MIGKLYGVIDDIDKDYIILKVNDIGYIVYVTATLLKSYKVGDKLSLFIDTYMREDQVKLYGLQTKQELSFLRMLVKVKGISHKIATTILSEVTADQIVQAIVGKNPVLLKVSGVGMKLATRIVTELEGVINDCNFEQDDALTRDAASALINLGYNANQSYDMVKRARKQHTDLSNINDLIRLALQEHEKE